MRLALPFVAPFATWIALQSILPATAGMYAIRSAIAFIVLLWAWRKAEIKCAGTVPVSFVTGLAGGLLVLALWVLPEYSDFYRTWFVWPLGTVPVTSTDPSPYDPSVCGWPLTIVKLCGSAFVIAPAEEIFFRSFLYRWLQNQDFKRVPLTRFDLSALMWCVLLFTLEHDRPLAAALCAVIYGLLSIRFGIASAIIAHVTTNLLLALYVIQTNRWDFW